MKVAIVRGPGLSKWEMQIYEPLTKWFTLLGIGSKIPVNDISGIKFPVTKLHCPSQYISLLPKFMPMMFSLFGDTQYLWGFDSVIRGFDLVHSVELANGYTLQAVRAKKKGLVKAVTLTVYENIPFAFDEYDRRQVIKREVIEGADRFLAVNEMARQALLLEGVEEKKISIVPQSVDTKIFRPSSKDNHPVLTKLRRQLGLVKDDFIVLSVGRIVWEKGWWDLLCAVAAIKKSCKRRIKYLLVGDGLDRNYLQTLSRKIGVDKDIVFTGPLPYSQMPTLFSLANIFVYPSLPTKHWNAQFGGVLIEAMATALPIVASLNGGTVDTVGKGGGIFVQPQHFSQLAKAIITLAENDRLRQTMGLVNRKTAIVKYDVKAVAEEIKKIWEEVLREKNGKKFAFA